MRDRHGALVAVTSTLEPRPRVLALTQYSDTLWVAGGNSTEGGVITAAGGFTNSLMEDQRVRRARMCRRPLGDCAAGALTCLSVPELVRNVGLARARVAALEAQPVAASDPVA